MKRTLLLVPALLLVLAASRSPLVADPRKPPEHYVAGPAPAWLREGVSHLDHDEHIKERVKMLK